MERSGGERSHCLASSLCTKLSKWSHFVVRGGSMQLQTKFPLSAVETESQREAPACLNNWMATGINWHGSMAMQIQITNSCVLLDAEQGWNSSSASVYLICSRETGQELEKNVWHQSFSGNWQQTGYPLLFAEEFITHCLWSVEEMEWAVFPASSCLLNNWKDSVQLETVLVLCAT